MIWMLVSQVQCTNIYEIQFQRDANQNSLCNNQTVTNITGIVFTPAGITGTRNFYIYERPYGPWRGILVFSSQSANFPTLNPGDSIVITTASVTEYFNNTEIIINNNANIQIVANNKPLPNPNIITGAHLDTTSGNSLPVDSAEAYEGTLVRINNAIVVQTGVSLAGWTTAQAYDGSGYFYFRYGHSGFTYNPQVGQLINIQGVVYTRGGQYVIVPRNDNDVEIQTISINIAYALDRNRVRLLYTRDINQISNALNPSTYTFTPSLTITNVSADPENTKGVIISTSNQIDGKLYKLVANNGGSLNDSTKFFGGFMQINKVQSTFRSSANPDTQSMFLSAYIDSGFPMTMTGVVTGAGNRFPSYWWFMQSSNTPFSGITIWNGNSPWWNATEGDSVIVVGLIEEFQGLTEIAQIKYYRIVSNNNNYLPAKVKVRQLAYSNDTSEYYESMLIKVDSAIVVDTGTTTFFLIADYSNHNNPNAPRIQVQKANLGPYVPRVGDMLRITGNFRRWMPSAGVYNSRIYPRFQTDIEFIATSVAERKENIEFSIKGNRISFILPNDKNYSVDIYSIDGRKLISKIVNSKNPELVLNLKKGLYLIKLDRKSYKIIIN